MENTFFAVVYERALLAARLQIIEETLLPIKTALLNTSPLGRNYKSDPNFRDWVKSIHARQLNAIAEVFMLFEDYFVYSSTLRSDPSQLFNAVASDKSFTSETKELNDITLPKLRNCLHISESYPTASSKDSAFLTRMTTLHLKEIKKRIKRLIRFWTRYYTVYLAYKHKFSALIGGYDVLGNSIVSFTYVRHNRGKSIHTSVIPCEIDAIDYYEDIVDDLSSVFRSLIDNFVLYVINCGKPFFPELPVLPANSLSTESQTKLQELIDKMPFYSTRIGYALKMELSPRKWKTISSRMKKEFIYESKQDILSRGAIDFN